MYISFVVLRHSQIIEKSKVVHLYVTFYAIKSGWTCHCLTTALAIRYRTTVMRLLSSEECMITYIYLAFMMQISTVLVGQTISHTVEICR